MSACLETNELIAVMKSSNRSRLIICGAVMHQAEEMVLLKGDGGFAVVPFSAFQPSGDGTKPDFDDLSIIDFGQTIKLGEYEAATDAILE